MASSSIFAFADNTTDRFYYYEAGSNLNPYFISSGKNSADVMGYVLEVLSNNQSKIYDKLSSMSSGGADLTTVNSYITAIDSKLGVIRDSLGIGSSLENVLSNQSSGLGHLNMIYNQLHYWDNNHARSYDISEMIYNIMNYNSDIVENTSSVPAIKNDTAYLPDIKNDTSNLSSILTSVNDFKTANHTDVTSVKTSLDNFKTENHNDITSLKTSVDNFMIANHNDIVNFQTYYNNINWVSGGTYYGVLNGSDTSYTTSNFYSKDITFVMSLNKGSSKIYRVILPFTLYNANTYDTSYDVYIYRQSNNQKLDKLNIIGINNSYQNATEFIFTIPDNYNTLQIGINVKSNKSGNFIVYGSRSADIYYLNSDTKDYLDVYDNALLFNINKLLNQAKEIFFDDETLAAKRANAAQTTAVLNNYTGNGSASASAADFGDIKDSVGSVKSGLNTNVSVSNIFNIFNNNDGYSFWSNDTKNELNSTGSNRNNLKTRGVSDTPLYDAKISELYNAMGVNHE